MMDACTHNATEVTQRIIGSHLVEHEGVDVNQRDRWDCVPLYLACLAGHLDVAKYLLDAGAVCNEYTFDGDRCHYGKNRKIITNCVPPSSAAQMTHMCVPAMDDILYVYLQLPSHKASGEALPIQANALASCLLDFMLDCHPSLACAQCQLTLACVRHLLSQYEQRPPPLPPLASSLRSLSTLCEDPEVRSAKILYEQSCRPLLGPTLSSSAAQAQGSAPLLAGQWADFAFVINGVRIPLHRALLSARSPFFHHMLCTLWQPQAGFLFQFAMHQGSLSVCLCPLFARYCWCRARCAICF